MAQSPTATKPVAAKSVATPIRPAFQITRGANKQRFLKLLVYGDYGQGKTYLAGTAVSVTDMQDVLLLNAESGDLTLAENVGGHDFTKIDTVPATSYKQVGAVYNFLKLHCQYRDEDNVEKLIELEEKLTGETGITVPRKYRTVIIDSLTEVETYCMNQLLGVTDSTRIDEEVAVAEWPDFRRNRHMVSRLVRNFRDLPMHVIFTCSRQYQQDEQKKMIFNPSMTGKLAAEIQGFVDMVGYYTTVAGDDATAMVRRLYVQPTGRWAAKNRFSLYKKPYFDNPTIGSVLKDVGLLDA